MADNGMALLQHLSNAISAAINPTEKSMTRDEFVTYASSELIAMTKDAPDVAKRRLAALEKAVADARKSKPGETIRVKMFAVDHVDNPDPTVTTQDPPKSSERGSEKKDETTPAAKNNFASVIADLDTLLGRQPSAAPTAPAASAAPANGAPAATAPEAGKAFPPAGGGGGGSGTPPKDKEEDEEDDELLAMGKQRRRALKRADLVEVDVSNNPNDLFPDNMNDLRRARSGKLFRERRVWGDDPAAVRSNG